MLHEQNAGKPYQALAANEAKAAAADALKQATDLSHDAQAQIVHESQHAFDRWLARRREASHAIAVLGRDAIKAQSPQDIIVLWMNWSRGVVDRLVADANDQVKIGTAIVRNVTTELVDKSANLEPRATDEVDPNKSGASDADPVRH